MKRRASKRGGSKADEMNFLVLRRRAVGLDQQSAAKKLGISATWLCQIEKGNRKPSEEMTPKFARVYATDPEQIAWFIELGPERYAQKFLGEGPRVSIPQQQTAA
jgi:transcriptional regulator with XRE-family HTH domain